ncbi:MAG: ABC transporter permease subunit [Gammaproteobacteria bacterium]|nr:ABC transporter permease subunit [Gammaproteobacteria bacterium]MYH46440.1 ABC transporter permease subunit [Gammaproteobacteria bacterium]MYL13372.1 ABC transporter permease subunit [Gammaproteobacteria bacterium]
MISDNLREQLLLLPEYLEGHLLLTLIALSLGIAVSVPLGVLANRQPALKRPLLISVSVLQTIPSVAILALTVAALGGRIGLLPALVALLLYSMLPIVRNTVTGLENVADDVVEAARGIGMSRTQILTRVRLPLALPVIIAGIRTAAVWTVGLATLSTLVGATSLGNYIFTGLQTRNLVAVTVGSIAAAVMAVILDAMIGSIQWLVENRNNEEVAGRYRRVFAAVAGAVLLGAGVSAWSLLPEPEADFVVGGKGFTEQHIIAGLLARELIDAGFRVDQRLGLGTQVIYEATANNTVDAYLEYSGTVWANIMNRNDNPGRAEVLAEVVDFVETTGGMNVIGEFGFQNLYALAMRKDRAAELGVNSIEDLIPVARQLTAGGDLEFFGRPEWISVRDTYGIDFARKLTFDTTLMYTAVDERQVDLITAYTSDGRIAHFDLLVLEDPRNAMLPYDGFLLTSGEAAQNPEFIAALADLAGRIPDEIMREANRIVDVEGRSVTDAVEYLRGAIHGVD